MADKDVGASKHIDGSGLRVVVVRTRWNPDIIDRLADGAARILADSGITEIEVVEVPGAFEIPFAARTVAESGRVDAIVAIGAVIRGETTHYAIVSEECARGLQHVQIATGVPIGFGVLATENVEQALARSEVGGAVSAHVGGDVDVGDGDGGAVSAHNVGADAARAAVEMALLVRAWS